MPIRLRPAVSCSPQALRFLPALVLAVMCASAAPALAANGHGLTNSFGSASSTVPDSEPLSGPTGIAWSQKTGEVYVIDAGNNRIERFSSTGAYEGQFNGSETPAGQFSSPNGIAVDNDPSSESYGDVYVADAGHDAVDKFASNGTYSGYQLTEETTGVSFGELAGVAVDPSGNLFVDDQGGGIDKFDDSANNSFAENVGGGFSLVPGGIAVDSIDDLYVVLQEIHNVLRYVPGVGLEFFAAPGGLGGCACVRGTAVDPASNNVYVDQGTSVAEYPPSPVEGDVPVEFGSEVLSGSGGIAVSATHLVYVANPAANDIDVFEEGPLPAPPVTGKAGPVEGVSATVEGKLEGGETGYRIAYGANGACTGASTSTTPLVAATGTTKVSTTITGLIAKTKYTFCLQAVDKYGHESGSPETFETTSSAPAVEATSSSVRKVHATLAASVNPELEESTCVFQYGTSEAYEHETPCQPQTLGKGSTGVPATANITGLEPTTTYDYRVLATNHTGTQPGPNETFTTEINTPAQVETTPATDVTTTSARLGGQVNPQGGATYYIEYGSPTCSLNGISNFVWWLCASKSGEAGPLTGISPETVAPIEITGLTPGTTYSYWIVATNKNGSERGEEAMFMTAAATPAASPPPTLTPAPLITTHPAPPAPAKPPVKKKTAAQEKAEKLSEALKQCKKDKAKAKRKTCEASAHHKFGTKPKKRSAK
jgi:hypothetical protein